MEAMSTRRVGNRCYSFCCECGPNVTVDEDGCCAGCGGNAMGSALNTIRIHDPDAARVVRAAVKWAHLNRNNEGPLSVALNAAVSRLQRRKGKKK